MKVSYKKFEDRFFLTACGQISTTQSKSYLKKRIGKFLVDFREKYEIYSEEKEELQYKYAEKNNKGELVKIRDKMNGESVVIKPEKKDIFNKEFKELLKKEVELPELRESWLNDCGLSYGQFSALINVITLDVDDEQAEKDEKEKEKEK